MVFKLKWGFTTARFTKEDCTVQDIKADVGKGWGDIIDRLVADLEKLGWDGTVLQVKEKFGGLRFYVGGVTDEIFDRIQDAEYESGETCEFCGAPGSPQSPRWWTKTVCGVCPASIEFLTR